MCSFADSCKGTECVYNRMMNSTLLLPEAGVILIFLCHLLMLSRIHNGIKVVNVPSVL